MVDAHVAGAGLVVADDLAQAGFGLEVARADRLRVIAQRMDRGLVGRERRVDLVQHARAGTTAILQSAAARGLVQHQRGVGWSQVLAGVDGRWHRSVGHAEEGGKSEQASDPQVHLGQLQLLVERIRAFRIGTGVDMGQFHGCFLPVLPYGNPHGHIYITPQAFRCQ